MNNVKIKEKKEVLSLSDQSSIYTSQYLDSIMLLLNSKKVENFIFPLINLIHQYIELLLKDLILDYDIEPFTAVEMKIDTHNLKTLIRDEFFYKEEFRKIDFFNDNYLLLEKSIVYFSSVLGNSTFFNSRYPTPKNINIISVPNYKINVLEIKYNFELLTRSMSNILNIFAAEKFLDCMIIDFKLNGISFTQDNFDNAIETILKDIELDDKKQKELIKLLVKELYENNYCNCASNK